jgi:hypothetical protein
MQRLDRAAEVQVRIFECACFLFELRGDFLQLRVELPARDRARDLIGDASEERKLSVECPQARALEIQHGHDLPVMADRYADLGTRVGQGFDVIRIDAHVVNDHRFRGRGDMSHDAAAERTRVADVDFRGDGRRNRLAEKRAALAIDRRERDELPVELRRKCVGDALQHRPQLEIQRGDARHFIQDLELPLHAAMLLAP